MSKPATPSSPARRRKTLSAPRPANPAVVVLRESELDCDVGTAIGRVRADGNTARSPILLVGAEESVPTDPAGAALLAGATNDGLRRLGARMLALLDCQDRFFDELRLSLEEMQGTVRDESRARIQRQVDTLGEILEWCETVHADLVLEGRRAKAGDVPLDLVRIARNAALSFRDQEDEAVAVVGTDARPCWGNEANLTQLIRLAIELVSRRCGGQGPITVQVGMPGAAQAVRVWSHGEPLPFAASKLVERFRAMAEAAGATVLPDALGPGCAGIVLRLPFVEA